MTGGGEQNLPSQEQPPKVDAIRYAFCTIHDALLRSRFNLSYLEIIKATEDNSPLLHKYQKYDIKTVARTAEILGFGNDFRGEYVDEWNSLPEENRENFLDWLAKKDDAFRLRYEGFLAEIAPLSPSPTAAAEIQKYLDEEQRKKRIVSQERQREKEAQPNIADMSESELRQEVVKHINDTLGKLAQGPLADGTGAFGYGREPDRRKHYDNGILLPLICSYVRFTKAFREDEQIGVRLELLGIFYSGQMYVDMKPQLDKKAERLPQMTTQEREDFEKFTVEMDAVKEAIEKDGLAPAENRYYFIPLSGVDQAVVSTESFISRAYKANPQAVKGVLLPETISTALKEQEVPIEPATGKPKWRIANLQDLRDAVAIAREYKYFIAEIIERTPKDLWGRPGLT